jgi:hypothetical protein
MDKLIKRFPLFELSYETVKHRKVPTLSNSVYMAIPVGKKYFVWFTYVEDKNICLLLELTRYKNDFEIKHVFPVSCSFDSSLALGTILYGTVVIRDGIKIFMADTLYYYKGKNVSQYVYAKKLTMLSLFFKQDIRQSIYHRSQLLFMMPYFRDQLQDYINEIHMVPYRIYTTQIRSTQQYTAFTNYPDKSIFNCKDKVMLLKPCIQNDLYEIYCKDKDQLKCMGFACINSYKTSVWLNRLFRNIKENANLDTLELSDEEEEFENIDQDKFVDLTKQLVMKCKYHSKFKAWEPICVMNDSTPLSSVSEI